MKAPTTSRPKRIPLFVVATMTASLFTLSVTGCWGTSAPAPPSAPTAQEEVKSTSQAEGTKQSSSQPQKVDAANDSSEKTERGAPAESVARNATASSLSVADSETQAQPSGAGRNSVAGSRVLVLAEGGPILMELDLTLDGRSLGQAFDEILAGVQRDADSDKDGMVTWDELTKLPRIRDGFLGNARLESERERREFVRQYDVNRNGQVDEVEWARVFREGSQSGRAFSVENRDDHRDWNRSASPLFGLLDVDSDQSLSAAECDAASRRLLRLDADDDEHLQPYEVSATRIEMPGMENPTQRRSSGPKFAWHLSSRSDWNAVIRACQITYAVGGPLASGCFPQRPGLFERLDSDANGRLSLVEFQQLSTIEPHVRFAVRWGSDSTSSASADDSFAFELTRWSPELGVREESCMATQRGVRLRLGRSLLEVFARESSGESASRRATQILSQFDANKNAYLDGDEIAAALTPLMLTTTDVDQDENEQITTAELTAALGSRLEASAAQVRVVASHPEDAVWTLLDQDFDAQLSGGELDSAPRRLRARDEDGSGTITAEELPEVVFLAVVRGEIPTGLVAPEPQPTPPSANAPTWFLRMDGNSDGRLSGREFLGERAQFEQLDVDGDGFLSIHESAPQPP
jgi:Ca2+-binding EF-hand superfamily protein